jgi:hypothetical protein
MDALGLTSGTVSLRLGRLVMTGTVARERDPDDRRGSVIRLTKKGQRLFDVIAPEHLANQDRLLSALTEDQRSTFSDLLRHLLASLETPRCPAAERLGIRLEPAAVARMRRQAVGLSDTPGLLVASVEPASAAEKAGLARGDLVVGMNGQPALASSPSPSCSISCPGDQDVRLTVLRGNKPHKMEVTPCRRPQQSSSRASPNSWRPCCGDCWPTRALHRSPARLGSR